MKRIVLLLSIIAAIAQSQSVRGVTIETVHVGNPGNAGELSGTAAGGIGPDAIVGAVPYEYRIGKYEVTNAQYVEFLNAVYPEGGLKRLGLYNPRMSSGSTSGIIFSADESSGSKYSSKQGRANYPVTYISWISAIRFVNWMHNGQGDGDTETGAYTLEHALIGGNWLIDIHAVTRNPDAIWFLPSEDEWYKAAYHKNDGVTGNYWSYPTSSDVMPYSAKPPGSDAPDPSNTVNANGFAETNSSGESNYLTEVGAYSLSISPYGTFDQAGSQEEWNETIITSRILSPGTDPYVTRGKRGGSWIDGSIFSNATWRSQDGMYVVPERFGFRVATIAVPEPTVFTLATLAICVIAGFPGRLRSKIRARPEH